MSVELDYFEICSTYTFSLTWIENWVEDFSRQGENEMTATVYWCIPWKKNLSTSLSLIEDDSHIVEMMATAKDEKPLWLMVDYSNFLKSLNSQGICGST
jgi:hypothetical protein